MLDLDRERLTTLERDAAKEVTVRKRQEKKVRCISDALSGILLNGSIASSTTPHAWSCTGWRGCRG